MSDFHFRRTNRLLSPAEFQPLFDQPDFRASGAILLLLARRRDPNQSEPRLGLVIGRRRVRLSVHRNTIRRVSRETFRRRKDTLAGLDIVLLVKAPVARADRQALRVELERLWDKLLAKAGQA